MQVTNMTKVKSESLAQPGILLLINISGVIGSLIQQRFERIFRSSAEGAAAA